MVPENILSKNDAIFLLDLINESLSCGSEKEFRVLLRKLKDLINFEYAITASIDLDADGSVKSYEILNLNYPAQWLEAYVEKRYDLIDPIVIENIKQYDVQYWNNTYKKYKTPKDFIYTANDFGLKEGYTYGLRNLKCTHGSIFSFSGPKGKHLYRTECILKYAIPHFHQMLARLMQKNITLDVNPSDILLSPRQKEILNWIKQGKSSWEISVILKISERTVNYHTYNIMHKLGVVKRSHAVAAAVEKGCIHIL